MNSNQASMLSMKVNSKFQDCALKIMQEYVEKNVITSEKFDETYPNTYDLKVLDVEITQVLIDSLRQDKAMNFLKSNYPKHKYLCASLYRVCLPGKNYLSWHRDRYFNGSNGLKLFWYPSLGKEGTNVIGLSGGKSWLKVPHLKNRFTALLFKLIYSIQLIFLREKKIKSSDSQLILLNTSTLHKPLDVLPDTVAPRVVAFIATKEQLVRFPNSEYIDIYKD
jgi:hypothetical protein